MTLQVIGAGFGRTGTLSLKQALEQLGFNKCYHMLEVGLNTDHDLLWRAVQRGEPVDLDALFDGYQATVDWPSCNYWEAQLAHFPDARVILSERDPERWYASVMNTIYPASMAFKDAEDEAGRRRTEFINEVVWDGVFGGRVEDKAYAIDIYLRHNQRVRELLGPDKLLVFEASQGWEPLCSFLNVEVPDVPYPRVNSTEDFQARVRSSTNA